MQQLTPQGNSAWRLWLRHVDWHLESTVEETAPERVLDGDKPFHIRALAQLCELKCLSMELRQLCNLSKSIKSNLKDNHRYLKNCGFCKDYSFKFILK